MTTTAVTITGIPYKLNSGAWGVAVPVDSDEEVGTEVLVQAKSGSEWTKILEAFQCAVKRGSSMYRLWTTVTPPEPELTPEEIGAWVGTVGTREIFRSLTVDSVKTLDFSYLVKFITPGGNRVAWFSSNFLNVVTGDQVTLTATVKDHREYKGRRETLVTRGKLVLES